VWGLTLGAVLHGARARWPGPGRVRVVGPDNARDRLGVVINWAAPRCNINIQYIYIMCFIKSFRVTSINN
jgi:hypothetical protein